MEVKLDHPSGQRVFYPARVVDRSLTYLRVRVIGTGSEISLTRWDGRVLETTLVSFSRDLSEKSTGGVMSSSHARRAVPAS